MPSSRPAGLSHWRMPGRIEAVVLMRILALNGASGLAGMSFGLLVLEQETLRTVFETVLPGRDAAGLPQLLASRLREQEWTAASLEQIAVVVGPGSFTGLRASLAFAHGLALGSGASVIGLTIGEALAPALREIGGGHEIWCVSQARRGRVFIERPGESSMTDRPVQAAMLDMLPAVTGPVLLGGDASELVADALRSAGVTTRLSGLHAPTVSAIASAAIARRLGMLPARAAQPLYVDPPEAKVAQAVRTAWAAESTSG